MINLSFIMCCVATIDDVSRCMHTCSYLRVIAICCRQRNERVVVLNLSHNEFSEAGAAALGRAIGELAPSVA